MCRFESDRRYSKKLKPGFQREQNGREPTVLGAMERGSFNKTSCYILDWTIIAANVVREA